MFGKCQGGVQCTQVIFTVWSVGVMIHGVLNLHSLFIVNMHSYSHHMSIEICKVQINAELSHPLYVILHSKSKKYTTERMSRNTFNI